MKHCAAPDGHQVGTTCEWINFFIVFKSPPPQHRARGSFGAVVVGYIGGVHQTMLMAAMFIGLLFGQGIVCISSCSAAAAVDRLLGDKVAMSLKSSRRAAIELLNGA